MGGGEGGAVGADLGRRGVGGVEIDPAWSLERWRTGSEEGRTMQNWPSQTRSK